MTVEPTSFDVCGDLPGIGTTLLEASAGTGKTFTVGALVTRYVAEGRARLEEMLVITFGRAASQELRERVRAQLLEAERALADPAEADPGNTLLTHLLGAEPAEREEMRRRLRDALADFDAATIATTHQFCQLVLRSLGVAGDTDARAELVDNLDDLVVEVVDDLYLQRFGRQREEPPFDRNCALDLARTAVNDPQARLTPASGPDSSAGARVDFACAVRAEVDARKRRLGILSYDDLLTRLAAALEDEQAPARDRMRGRWRIVLVDEFQDTDPVQWQVLDRAFSGHATMVLIGDPKQAIYAFRGGDVVTYLAAARSAATQATLGTNWRSDGDLVDPLQVLLRGAALGHPDIRVREVRAHHDGTRLRGAPHPAPFRIRRVPRAGFRLTRTKLIGAADARAHIARDCAADIAELLASGATWCEQPVEARHVAVIVGSRDHGLLVQRELHSRGVPAVVAGGGQLFTTPAAEEWLALLLALEQPHRSALVRSAALTSFLGHTAAELDDGGEELTGRVADRLRGWALLVRGRGVAALFEAAEERGLGARVLAHTDGERLLTDLRHLAQLLHETAVRERLGLTALLAWFREEQRRTGAPGASERPRRLDADTAAVQIVTIHGSKGLQYPITYLPFAYQSFEFDTAVARYHDDAGRRTLDVGGSGPGWDEHLAQHRAEEGGEELRDLYVALTRAQSQVVAWWAPTLNTRIGGLHRLLFGRRPGTAEVPDNVEVKDDAYAERVLGLVADMGGPVAEVSVVADAAPPVPAPAPGRLTARRFDRHVDADWRRTSYSGLIRVEDSVTGEVGSEPEVPGLQDEPEVVDPAVAPDAATAPAELLAAAEVPSPMAELPAGATFGSLVHAVLEHADPAASDMRAELRRVAAEQLPWWPVATTPDALADALVPVLETPLGPLAPGWTLGRVPLHDRLRELEFEIPLAGGDLGEARVAEVRAGEVRAGEVRLRHLAPLLRAHLPTDDPLAGYADRLERPPLGDQPLRGYLSGSVDAVLRLPTAGGDRFVVVDYKTNLLGEPDRLVTAADYAPERLAAAMLHSHYPLQALLYSVVVHRYLRWRLSHYQPATHLAGVLYLYVRGMCGAAAPLVGGEPCGVFSWRPPADLVEALSDLLDGGPVSSEEIR